MEFHGITVGAHGFLWIPGDFCSSLFHFTVDDLALLSDDVVIVWKIPFF